MLQITEEGKVQKAKCELHPMWPHFIEVRARRVNLHDLLISASYVSSSLTCNTCQDHAAELELARLAQDMKRAEMQVELVAR